MAKYKLYLENLSRDLGTDEWDDVFDCGMEITPKTVCDVQSPGVWDAAFEVVDDDTVAIVGGLDAGGFGNVRVELPKCEVQTCYEITIMIDSDGPYDDLIETLQSAGIRCVKCLFE